MPLPSFNDLERLKKYCSSLGRTHRNTMEYYISDDKLGFFHQTQSRKTYSLSSTATCIASLVHSGLWDSNFPLWSNSEEIGERLVKSPWRSGKLPKNNPFSVAFMMEGVLDLQLACPYPSRDDHVKKIKADAAPFLLRPLKANGCVHIRPYPPSAFLSQLAFRVLDRLEMVERDVADRVHSWAREEINKEVALLSAQSRIADPLNLGYALILATMSASDEQTSPEDKRLFSHALRELFESQNPAGFWPYGRPLFHYPEVGNAHCYEYEFLTQLLMCQQLRMDLLPYLTHIGRAAQLLESTSFDLRPEQPATIVGWASGHHPQIKGPESWSTACVYDFVHAFDRLIAEAIRRAVFEELDVIYWPPRLPRDPAKDEFAGQLLDAHLAENPANLSSLKQVIAECFVYPIAREAARIGKGGRLQKEKAPMSAIFFGPPGTSKTDLGKHISEYIGWPLLSVDPSYLVSSSISFLL